ncbi:efflux transporter, RND family, MFP subunit, partial [Acidithiobacillus sp. GGI-221]
MNKAFARFPLMPIVLFLCAWLGGVAPAFALPVQAVAVQPDPLVPGGPCAWGRWRAVGE